MSPPLTIVLLVTVLAAVSVVVRLMLARRNELIQQLHEQAEAEAQRKLAEQKKAAKAKRKAG